MIRSTAVALLLATAVLLPARNDTSWVKFVSQGGRIEFSHPAGWIVTPHDVAFAVRNPSSGEELSVFCCLPPAPGMSVGAYAELVVPTMLAGISGLKASNPVVNSDSAGSEVFYVRQGQDYRGATLVLKREPQGTLLLFATAAQTFDAAQAGEILNTVAASVRYGQAAAPAPGASPIQGNWSTSHIYTDLVDSRSGAFRRSRWHEEQYSFGADGSFRHVTAASGSMISGILVERGTYSVAAGRLVLRQTLEDWHPDASHPGQDAEYENRPRTKVREFRYRLEDANTLILDGPTVMTRLHRQTGSR